MNHLVKVILLSVALVALANVSQVCLGMEFECPDGYVIVDERCNIPREVGPEQICPQGYFLDGGSCQRNL